MYSYFEQFCHTSTICAEDEDDGFSNTVQVLSHRLNRTSGFMSNQNIGLMSHSPYSPFILAYQKFCHVDVFFVKWLVRSKYMFWGCLIRSGKGALRIGSNVCKSVLTF